MKHKRTHYILYALLPLLSLAGCSENEAPGTFEPQLEVLPATGVERSCADLHGIVTLKGNTPMPAITFHYGKTRFLEQKVTAQALSSGDTLTVSLSHLTPGTTYYWCMTADNGQVKLTTDTLRVDAYMHDVQNKYTSGIDADTIRMYVDGINVSGNDKYQFVAEPDGSIAHLYDLKLPDGDHTVAVSVRDKFGNETTETRSFKVKTDNASTHSSVFVAAAESNAVIGKTVSLNVTATGTDIQKATALLSLGNSFKNYTVTFSDNYEGTYSYSKLTKILTVNAERKADAVAVDNNIVATVTVDIPSNLSANDKFNYTVKGGSYTTADGYYSTYSAPEASLRLITSPQRSSLSALPRPSRSRTIRMSLP